MKHEPKKYSLFCCACGDKFIAVRSDARTCSEGCRLALSRLGKVIKEHHAELSKEDAEKLEQTELRIKEEGTGIIHRIKYRKDVDDTIIIPDAIKKQLTTKELNPKRKKKEKEPKNDKNLIPGEMGKEMDKLEKKDKKEKKKSTKGDKE